MFTKRIYQKLTDLEWNQPPQAEGEKARRREVFICKNIVWEVEGVAQCEINPIVVKNKGQFELAVYSIKNCGFNRSKKRQLFDDTLLAKKHVERRLKGQLNELICAMVTSNDADAER